MKNHGWIKLHRKSLDHWLYNEDGPRTRREAWEDILLLCNHNEQKVLVQGELIECVRGQSIKSLKTWAKQFRWTIQKVRSFFKLLESDGMINVEGLRKTTRITVCNYDYYQSEQQANNKSNSKEITSNQQGDNKEIATNKNEKNEKNEKKMIYMSELKDSDDTYEKIAFSFWILIQENLNSLNIKDQKIENAKIKNWVPPVRRMIEIDKRSTEELQKVWRYLKASAHDDKQNGFSWAGVILSTRNLREKFTKILISANKPPKGMAGMAQQFEEVSKILDEKYG